MAKNIERAAEAEETYNEFVERGTELTDEGREAAFEFAAANAAVEESAIALDNSGVTKGIRRLAELLDISTEAARDFLVEAGVIDALELVPSIGLDTSEFDRNFANALNKFNRLPGIQVTAPQHESGTQHTGGRVNAPRGQEVLVRALGGETFTNPSHSNGDGGGTTVIVNGFVGSELALAAELDRLLTRRSRSSPLGFQ